MTFSRQIAARIPHRCGCVNALQHLQHAHPDVPWLCRCFATSATCPIHHLMAHHSVAVQVLYETYHTFHLTCCGCAGVLRDLQHALPTYVAVSVLYNICNMPILSFHGCTGI